MKKQKLYLETSVWNFYYADDAPEKKEATIRFFKQLEKGEYKIFISRIVFDEIERASVATQKKLFSLISSYSPEVLELDAEADRLANGYIENGVLTKNCLDDARHAAIATVNKMDNLLSWNMKHLANFSRMSKINEINRKCGYKKILILITP